MRRHALTLAWALAFAAFCYRFMDLLGDSFWSIASGRWVLAHGFPATDPFSYTASNVPWVVHMPLSQVLFAVVADGLARLAHTPLAAAGAIPPVPAWTLLGLEAFASVVEGLALALVVLPYAKTSMERLLGIALVVCVVLVESDDLAVRGQIFGDLAFSTMWLLVYRVRDGKRAPWWAVALLASSWINLHSSCFLLVAVPLFFALMTALSASERLQARAFLGMAAIAAIAFFATPQLHRLPLDLVRLMSSPSTRTIDLFRPPSLGEPTVVLGFVVLFAIVVWVLRVAPSRAEGYALLALTCAAAASRRFLPLALMGAIPMLLRAGVPLRSLAARRIGAWAHVLAFAVLSAIGLSEAKDPFRDVPMVEAAKVEALALPDHVACPYHWGGYLDYAWSGRRKTFLDGRNQLFDNGTFDAETRLRHGERVDETLWAYRISTVIEERGSALDRTLRQDPAWRLVHVGRIAVLFTRRTPIKLPAERPTIVDAP